MKPSKFKMQLQFFAELGSSTKKEHCYLFLKIVSDVSQSISLLFAKDSWFQPLLSQGTLGKTLFFLNKAESLDHDHKPFQGPFVARKPFLIRIRISSVSEVWGLASPHIEAQTAPAENFGMLQLGYFFTCFREESAKGCETSCICLKQCWVVVEMVSIFEILPWSVFRMKLKAGSLKKLAASFPQIPWIGLIVFRLRQVGFLSVEKSMEELKDYSKVKILSFAGLKSSAHRAVILERSCSFSPQAGALYNLGNKR